MFVMVECHSHRSIYELFVRKERAIQKELTLILLVELFGQCLEVAEPDRP